MGTYVQSSANPLELSFDNGSTWKVLVCPTNWTRNLAATLTETDTITCGTLQGAGTPKFDFSGEAVTDIDPGALQCSQEDLEGVLLTSTPILARVRYPSSGSISSLLYLRGSVYVESVGQKNQANDLIKFDFSLKGTGVPTLAP